MHSSRAVTAAAALEEASFTELDSSPSHSIARGGGACLFIDIQYFLYDEMHFYFLGACNFILIIILFFFLFYFYFLLYCMYSAGCDDSYHTERIESFYKSAETSMLNSLANSLAMTDGISQISFDKKDKDGDVDAVPKARPHTVVSSILPCVCVVSCYPVGLKKVNAVVPSLKKKIMLQHNCTFIYL